MTYYHSPAYYRIRSAVRLAFWVGVSALVALATYLVLQNSPLFAQPDKPYCDITVNRDFTWAWNGVAVPLADCTPPEDIVVNGDGTWDWYLSPVLGGK